MGQIRILNKKEAIAAINIKLRDKKRLSVLAVSIFLMFEIAIFESNPFKILGFVLVIVGTYKLIDYKLVEMAMSKERKRLLAVYE